MESRRFQSVRFNFSYVKEERCLNVFSIILKCKCYYLLLGVPLLSEVRQHHGNPDFRGYCSKRRGGTNMVLICDKYCYKKGNSFIDLCSSHNNKVRSSEDK